MPSDQETTIQLTKSPSRQVSVVPLCRTSEVLLRERRVTFVADCGQVTGYPVIRPGRTYQDWPPQNLLIKW
jgi:hypothetical protein